MTGAVFRGKLYRNFMIFPRVRLAAAGNLWYDTRNAAFALTPPAGSPGGLSAAGEIP